MASIEIKVDLSDLQGLLSRLQSNDVENALEKGMKVLASRGRDLAKLNTPKITGNLQKGWFVKEVSATHAVISNPTYYAEYVENGHTQEPGRYVPKLGKRLVVSWVPGLFFAKRSAEQLRDDADKIIKPVIEEEVSKILNG